MRLVPYFIGLSLLLLGSYSIHQGDTALTVFCIGLALWLALDELCAAVRGSQ